MAQPSRPSVLSRVSNFFKSADRKIAEQEAMVKALGAVAAAIGLDEDLTKAYRSGGVMPGGTFPGGWGNTGGPGVVGSGAGANAKLLARVTQGLASQFNVPMAKLEAALATQGLSWGPPFPPGRPLNPFFGYRRPPRTRDFQVGENVQIQPRWGRISFGTLKSLWDAYDVAQICTKHLINDVRSLDYHFEAARGVIEDVSDEIKKAYEFMEIPDKRQPFRHWLHEYLTDVIRYDAGALYVRRNKAGDAIALEVISGDTLIPIIDYYGRPATDEDDMDPQLTPKGMFEGEITPAFVQIVQGLPWDWLAAEDMIYQPLNPMPESQYGLAPLEAVLLTANTDLRFQHHFLEYFTQGSIPQGFMEAPEGLSDPALIADWQNTWDALMIGDQAMLRRIRWVPFGSHYTPVGPGSKTNKEFDPEFPLYLMRRTCAAHGVTPADLGFTETVNKATSEVQVDVQFRVGTLPLVRHVEDVVNMFLQEKLKLRVRLRFDTGREIEDRLATAQAEQIYINSGVLSPDEPRSRLGYPVSLRRPTPRFIQNTRSGPVPLIALESLAGPTDHETFGPAKDAPLLDHPFHEVPGTLPPVGSRAYTEAQNAAALMQENMVAQGSKNPTRPQAGGKKPGGGAPGGGGPGGGGMMIDPKLGPQISGNKPVPERYGSDPNAPEGKDLTHPKLDTRKPKTPATPARSRSASVKKQEAFGAGIAVIALDTQRVLMLQRKLGDDKKAAAGKWEFPGGIPEDGESAFDAAKREWEEETGNKLPLKGRVVDTWKDDGYVLFVYLVKAEEEININPDRDELMVIDPDHPNIGKTEVTAWWDIDTLENAGKALRKELRDFDWDILREAAKKDLAKEGMTGGVTASSGMTGNSLNPDEDDDDEVEKIALILTQWRENAKNRLKKGRPPRRFVDPEVPIAIQELVWGKLQYALTPQAVNDAFQLVGD